MNPREERYKRAWARQKERIGNDPDYALREKERKVAYLRIRYRTDEEFREKMRERMREYMRRRRAVLKS